MDANAAKGETAAATGPQRPTISRSDEQTRTTAIFTLQDGVRPLFLPRSTAAVAADWLTLAHKSDGIRRGVGP